MIDFQQIIKSLQSEIEENIAISVSSIEVKSMREPFQYFMKNGGKRIRPVLTLLAAGLINDTYKNAMNAAVAIEILHNFTLIHDDIMDASPIRRGEDTVHIKYGVPNAILLGDLMCGIAFQLVEHNQNLSKVMNKALYDVCIGQALDIEYSTAEQVSEDEYLKMIELKTSSLIIASMLLGAYSNNADDETIQHLQKLGLNLGIAFQLQDDLLDLTANEADFGKAIGQDLIEGKKTFIIIEAQKLASEQADKDKLHTFYQNNGIPKEQISEFMEMLHRIGAIKATESKIESYYTQVLNEIHFFADSKYKSTLLSIVDSLFNRVS